MRPLGFSNLTERWSSAAGCDHCLTWTCLQSRSLIRSSSVADRGASGSLRLSWSPRGPQCSASLALYHERTYSATSTSWPTQKARRDPSLLIPSYPDLYRLKPSCAIEGYPGISHYKNLILAYPKATFQSVLMQGYSWISHSSGHPGISLYHFFRWWACFSTAISLPCFNPQALICRLQFCTICWNWLKSNRTCVWTKQDLSSG